MSSDYAETGQLQSLLEQIGAGLDRYLTFEHPDAMHTSLTWQNDLDQPLPQRGIGIEGVTEELLTHLIPHGSAIPRPGFSAFITTGGTTAATLATTAASIASPQRYHLTAFNFVEARSLEWLAQLFQLAEMQGVYSSGGSVANLLALGAARQAAYEQRGHDPAAEGINQPGRIYASEECHHTIQRSAGVLGLGRRAVCPIPCDTAGRMRLDALEAAIQQDANAQRIPIAIVANAGTTNTGAIDPLQAMGEIAKRHGIWFHIDGAYGLPGILDPRVAPLYQGLALADSVIVDPHKWLGASVGIAATFVRDRSLLYRAFTQEPADYLEGSVEQTSQTQPRIEHSLDDFGTPYFDFGVELSAPCRGVAVWAMLREIGVEGMQQRIRRHIDMARDLADAARQHPRLELLIEPTLSVCCFRYNAPQIDDLDTFNQQLYRQLVRENHYMPSTTRVAGQLAIRPCFVGARTEHTHAEGLLHAVLRIGDTLLEDHLHRRGKPC